MSLQKVEVMCYAKFYYEFENFKEQTVSLKFDRMEVISNFVNSETILATQSIHNLHSLVLFNGNNNLWVMNWMSFMYNQTFPVALFTRDHSN
jgi:hypothetical protein